MIIITSEREAAEQVVFRHHPAHYPRWTLHHRADFWYKWHWVAAEVVAEVNPCTQEYHTGMRKENWQGRCTTLFSCNLTRRMIIHPQGNSITFLSSHTPRIVLEVGEKGVNHNQIVAELHKNYDVQYYQMPRVTSTYIYCILMVIMDMLMLWICTYNATTHRGRWGRTFIQILNFYLDT